MNTEEAKNIAEVLYNSGNIGNAIVTTGYTIAKAVIRHKRDKIERFQVITSNGIGRPEYGEILQKKYFVDRICFDKNQSPQKLKHIKARIENDKFNDNHIMLVGASGLGKSTALRWLFLNVSSKRFDHLAYFPASFFQDCNDINEIIQKVKDNTNNIGRCVLFIDGVDELKCITGNEKDLTDLCEGLIQLTVTRRQSDKYINNIGHTIVMSTRPEHFGFSQTLKTKKEKMSYSRFSVYWFLPMNRNESEEMCIRTIKRYMEKNKDTTMADYQDKSPKDRKELSQYYKQLHRYLKEDNKNSRFVSVLDNPMLCRYSYAVIMNSRFKNKISADEMSEAKKREEVIHSVIGWEYHDGQSTKGKAVSKNDEKGIENENRVLSFLASMAFIADSDGKNIDKDEWNKQRKIHNISINNSLCFLEENSDGYLAFTNRLFYEYCLAKWYALCDKEILFKDDAINGFTKLLMQKEFAEMYLEFIENEECICQLKEINCMYDLFEFLQGGVELFYDEKMDATIEKILLFFPLSTLVYCNINFTYDLIVKIRKTSMLEIIHNDFIRCNINKITENDIDIICLISPNIKCISAVEHNFCVFYNNKVHNIYGCTKQSIPEIEFQDSFFKKQIRGGLLEDKDKIMYRMYQEWKFETEKRMKISTRSITNIVKDISFVFGTENCLWCIYDGRHLTIYKKTQMNSVALSKYFKQNSHYNSLDDYVYSYFIYISFFTKNNDLQNLERYDVRNFEFSFTHCIMQNDTIDISKEIMSRYYDLWWYNRRLAEVNSKAAIYKIPIINEYNILDKLVIDINSGLVRIAISDEKIITFMLLQDFDELHNVALDSLGFCEENNYMEGMEVRKRIIESKDLDNNEKNYELNQLVLDLLGNSIWV